MTRPLPDVFLELVPIGTPDPHLLAWLRTELERDLPWIRAAGTRTFAPREEWRLPRNGQRPADWVLDALVDWHDSRRLHPDRHWLLGITELDLCGPGREFVLGEATIGGCCALVSLARLHPTDHDPGDASAWLRMRLRKEAVHELGHMVGLDHCAGPACVMQPSAGVSDADAKPGDFCERCQRLLSVHLHRRA
jgi:predicted Zn-dependent protease